MSSSTMGTFIASGHSPPWLPRDVAEGRKYAWFGQLMYLLMALMWFIIAIVEMTLYVANNGDTRLAFGVFGIFAMIICFMSAVFMKKTVLDAIDQGRFHDAKNDTMIWLIIGVFGFALPTLFLLLTYVKLGDALTAQQPVGYQPYAPGTVAAQQPVYAPPVAPVPPPAAPAPAQQPQAHPQHAHQTPMMRCKNCNVQFPMFMHTCPNCGAPKE